MIATQMSCNKLHDAWTRTVGITSFVPFERTAVFSDVQPMECRIDSMFRTTKDRGDKASRNN